MEMTDDGKPLYSTSHPVAPWWYGVWVRLFRRDVRSSAVETVEIEMQPRSGQTHPINGGKR